MPMIARRNAMMTGKRLPYDAEVEYLESTGTQSIDTGIIVSSRMGLDITMQFNGIVSQSMGTSSAVGSVQRYTFGPSYNDWFFGGSNYVGRGSTVFYNRDHKNHCTIDTVARKWYLEDFTEGRSGSGNLPNTTFNIGNSYLLFSRSQTNSDGVLLPISYSKVTIWGHVKFWIDGTLVRDFQPVRFTNELGQTEGTLYDRVSGQLFRNAGTGAFGYGNDLKYPIPAE